MHAIRQMPKPHWLILAGLLLSAQAPAGEPPIELRNYVALDNTTTDQHGRPFTVTELSGITYLGGDEYLAVMDGSNRLVWIEIALSDDGAIESARVTRGLSLSQKQDFEGIAFRPARPHSVLLSEEDTPAVHEFDLKDGSLLKTFDVPPVFRRRRTNRGFESLALAPDGAALWTANEEALSVDGDPSSPQKGTTVRLLRYVAQDDTFVPEAQFAYQVEPMHGKVVQHASSGLSELAVLPDGTLLALERSFAYREDGVMFLSRLYAVDLSEATDISGQRQPLRGREKDFTPAAKTELWSGAIDEAMGMNLEGITVGPRLPDGRWSLVGVVDDGDPISRNVAVGFVLSLADENPTISSDR